MQTKQELSSDLKEFFHNPLHCALFELAKANQPKEVGRLIASRLEGIQYFREAGDLCLISATMMGFTQVAKVLLDAKANPCKVIPQADHNSALHYAAEKNRVDILNLILKVGGVDVNVKDAYGYTPLQRAASLGNEKILELLLQVVEISIEEPSPGDGFTALILTAYKGHAKSAALLMDAKADVEARASNGKTALCVAARNNHENVARVLLSGERKASTDTLEKNGLTPLTYASNNGNLSLMRLLLNAKAEVNGPSNSLCHLPLISAIESHQKEGIELLIQSKADINARDKLNRTPLCTAIAVNNEQAIYRLLECRADVQSLIPFHFFSQDKQQSCDPDNWKHIDVSPLMYAAMRCRIDTVRSLVAHKADVNQTTALGDTALSSVLVECSIEMEGRLPVLQYLIEQKANLYSVAHNLSILKSALNFCPFVVSKTILEAIVADAKSKGDSGVYNAIVTETVKHIFSVLMTNLTQDFRALLKFLLSTEPFAKLIQEQADTYYYNSLQFSYYKGLERLLDAGLVSSDHCEMLIVRANHNKGNEKILLLPPILKASFDGDLNLIKTLINAGASPLSICIWVVNNENTAITPLIIAKKFDQEEAAQYLFTRELLNSLHYAPKLKSWMSKNLTQIKKVQEWIDQVSELLLSMEPKIGYHPEFGHHFLINCKNFEFQRLIPRFILGSSSKIKISSCEVVKMAENLILSKKCNKVDAKESGKDVNKTTNKEVDKEGFTVEEFELSFWEVLKPRVRKQEQSLAERRIVDDDFRMLKSELDQNYRRIQFSRKLIDQDYRTLTKYIQELQALIQEIDELLESCEAFYHSDRFTGTMDASKVTQGLEKVQYYQEVVEKLEKEMLLAKQNLESLGENFEQYWENIEPNIRRLINEQKKREAIQAWNALKEDSTLNQLSDDADKQWSTLKKISTGLSDIKKILAARRQEEFLIEQASIKAEQRKNDERREVNKRERERMKLKSKELKKRRKETLETAQKQAERLVELERFRVERKRLAETHRREMEIKLLIERQAKASAGKSGNGVNAENAEKAGNSNLSEDGWDMLNDSDHDSSPTAQNNDLSSSLFTETCGSVGVDDKLWLEEQYTKFKKEVSGLEEIWKKISISSHDFEKWGLGKILVHRDAMLGLLGRAFELVHFLSPDLAPMIPEHAGHLRNVIFRNHSICPLLGFEDAQLNQTAKLKIQDTIKDHIKFYEQVCSFFFVVKEYFKAFVENRSRIEQKSKVENGTNQAQELKGDDEIILKQLYTKMISHPFYEILKCYKIDSQIDLKLCRERWNVYQFGASLYDQNVEKSILAHARGFIDGCTGVFARHIATEYRNEFYVHRKEYRKAIKAGKAYRHVDQDADEFGLYFAYRNQKTEAQSAISLLSRNPNP